jgi:hypothetical protein
VIELRNAIFYFTSIVITLFFFIVALSYAMLTISVNAARTSDLAGVEASIQRVAEQLAKIQSLKTFRIFATPFPT